MEDKAKKTQTFNKMIENLRIIAVFFFEIAKAEQKEA
jgi:hypothetical protein